MKIVNDWVPETPLELTFHELEHSADKWRPYLRLYERYLGKFAAPFASKPPVLVEVGVQKGGSLEMWAKHFGPESQIFGIDIDKECEKLNPQVEADPRNMSPDEWKNVLKQPNINITIAHQGDPNFWNVWLPTKPPIDIFIDDGSHDNGDQIVTFENVFPRMPVGGVYIIEDVHSSYMNHHPPAIMNINQTLQFIRLTLIDHMKKYIDIIHNPWIHAPVYPGLSSIHFHDSMIVIEKMGTPDMYRIFPKAFQAENSQMLTFKTG